MSPRAPLPGDLREAVRSTIAEVLMVPVESVQDDTALMRDLGAESIDMLDLVFHLEEVLGRKIPAPHWDEFLRHRLAGRDPTAAITTALVVAFVEAECAS